jgi:hypothetical protein
VPRKCNTSYNLIKYIVGCKTDKEKIDRGLLFQERGGLRG